MWHIPRKPVTLWLFCVCFAGRDEEEEGEFHRVPNELSSTFKITAWEWLAFWITIQTLDLGLRKIIRMDLILTVVILTLVAKKTH